MDVRLRPGGSSSRSGNYDVFLSFRGEGTAKSFTDRLFSALVQVGVRVFRDDEDSEEIEKGENIRASEIEKAIQQSRLAVVVLSDDHVSFKRCTEEFVKILKGSTTFGVVVLPVYYGADPSWIKERIAEAFGTSEEEEEGKEEIIEDQVRKGNLFLDPCISSPADINEPNFIQGVVEVIEYKLKERRSGLKEAKQDESWLGPEKNLENSGLSKLPENPDCPSLQKLFLQQNPDLAKIPVSFFMKMPNLQVLDLSGTSIKSLPPSISSLVRLRELLLRVCNLLMELPPEIEALTNLRMLDLEGTKLICLPKEIRWLLSLECLKVSFNRFSDRYRGSKGLESIIPRATLSKFHQLKELSIDVHPECGWWDTEVEAIMDELSTLIDLHTVKLYLPRVELLQRFLRLTRGRIVGGSHIYPTLSNFRLIVGRHEQSIVSRVPTDLQVGFEKLEKCLKYVNGEGKTDGFGQALKHASALFLDSHWSIEKLSVFNIEELDKLKFCLLVGCNELKTIIDGADVLGAEIYEEKGILGSLQYLGIRYMKNLETIWKGPRGRHCMRSLRVLALHTCPNLSTILGHRLVRCLENLEELIVENCRKVKAVESMESAAGGNFGLPRLEKISLLHLPELVNIFSSSWVAPKLQKMFIYNCPKLKTLSPMPVLSKQCMKEIKGESEWWEALAWHKSEQGSSQDDQSYFHSIFVPLKSDDDDLVDELTEAGNQLNTLHMSEASTQLQVARKGKNIVNIQLPVQNLKEKIAGSGLGEGSYCIPKPPDHIVGLNAPLEESKGMLLKDGVPVVVLSAPGGFGKTVLATMLCNDDEIRAIFGDIFFVHVSNEPNFKVIVQELFHQKGCQPPQFHSDDDAFNQLENLLREIGTHPILLVLDDVLFESDIQKLLFQIPGYKILVTSRFEFPQFDSMYKLDKLNYQDAMTLFCHLAFPQARSSDIPDNLVNQIVGFCEEVPLALVVSGRFLFQQPEEMWRMVLHSFSNEFLDSPNILPLRNCIDVLGENSIIKEHYLDLGSLPQGFPASALMDMWMELYKLDESSISNTYKPLRELSSRNLIKLESMSTYADGDDMELYDIEHYNVRQLGLTRELAIQQSSQEPIEQRSRLIVDISGNDLPNWWIELPHQPLHARLLSITTDEGFSLQQFNKQHQRFDIQLPEVKVAILNFYSQTYTLPLFMESMYELKALIVTNYGFRPAELDNFTLLGRLSNLRRIRLENVFIPPLCKILVQIMNLRKISLYRCKMGMAFQNCKNERYDLFPNLEEITIDSCIDLFKLPGGLCNLVRLKKLSISYCKGLRELPEGLGRLTDLDSLKLCGCSRLKGLPDSIGDLKKLEVLDISDCMRMTELPPRMAELCSLIKLNIAGCVRLTLPHWFVHLVQLKELVYSEGMHPLFESIGSLLPSLEIKVVRPVEEGTLSESHEGNWERFSSFVSNRSTTSFSFFPLKSCGSLLPSFSAMCS